MGCGEYGLPAPYGLLMLSGEYLLPYLPYGFDVESASYGLVLNFPWYLPWLS